MSSDANLVLEVIPPGNGWVLDLGGGRGMMRHPLERLGYRYVNLDIRPTGNDGPGVAGDAHGLPFNDECFELLLSKDTLEHFLQPREVVNEVYRVLKKNGLFVIWVPFMHPFHGNDLYRYTPLGLRHLLQEFEIISFDSPLWVFTIIHSILSPILKRAHLGFMSHRIKKFCAWLDRRLMLRQKNPSSFAAGYRIVVCKRAVDASP